MSEGTSKSDGTFMVGDNGQAANEQVVIRMSKVTKDQIETEFQSLGISGWQEYMAHLINRRQSVFVPQAAPKLAASAAKTSVQKTSKINWWIVGTLCIVMIALIVFLIKKQVPIPRISFK